MSAVNDDRRSPTAFQILRDVVTLVLIPIGLFMAATLLGMREDIILIKHKLDDHAATVTLHNTTHQEDDTERERIHHGEKVSESCIQCMGGLKRRGK